MDGVADINLENSPPVNLARITPKTDVHHEHHATHCKNCGATLTGAFCQSCGQSAHVHRSFLHVLEEVIHGITHLDSRTWRSIPMMLFRPGTLTRNYVMGMRVRYIPPFALFLASVFAMFLAFAFSGGPGFVSSQAVTASQSVQDARERVAERQTDVREAETEVTEATTELANVRADPDPMPGEEGRAVGALSSAQGVLTGAQARLSSAQNELSRVQEAAAAQRTQQPATSTSFKTEQEKSAALAEIEQDLIQARRENASVEVNALMLAKQVVSTAPIVPDGSDAKAKDGANAPKQVTAKIELDGRSADIVLDQSRNIMEMLKDSMRRGDFIVTSSPELNKKIAEKVKNPDLFLYKLQNTVYKFSFILVPLSLPFIWLLFFWKRGVTMFDHAVFALYSLSFVSFLFLMVSVLAHWAPASKVLPYAVLILPVHLFFQFKGAYALGWFSALWRTIVFGGLFSWVILMAFVLAIVALGVTG